MLSPFFCISTKRMMVITIVLESFALAFKFPSLIISHVEKTHSFQNRKEKPAYQNPRQNMVITPSLVLVSS